MDELYNFFMENISPFIAENWQLFVIAAGCILLMGSIFNWKLNPNGSTPYGVLSFIYHNFGEKAYRIVSAILSIVIIICGIVLWILE